MSLIVLDANVVINYGSDTEILYIQHTPIFIVNCRYSFDFFFFYNIASAWFVVTVLVDV